MDIKLKWVFGLGSPAAIYHDGVCDEVQIDPLLWFQMSREEREFILHHELAHCRYNIYDEVEADRVGFNSFVQAGGNPDAAYAALEELPDTAYTLHRMQEIQTHISNHQQSEAMLHRNIYRNKRSHFYIPCEDPANQSLPQCAQYWGPDMGESALEPGDYYPHTGGNGRDIDYWLDQAIDVFGAIAALKGQQHQPYPNYYPEQRKGISPSVIAIAAIALVLMVVIILKK